MTETNITMKILKNALDKTIEKYTIKYWEIRKEVPRFNPMKNVITVSVHLERSITTIWLVTYLPTLLMNFINQFSGNVKPI